MGGSIAGQLHPVDEHDDDRLDLDLDDKDYDGRLDLDQNDENYDDRLNLDLNAKDCPPFHRPGCKGLAKGTQQGQLIL